MTRRTVNEEIRRVRLELAKDLLAHSDIPIKRIAFETGFRTIQYMSRVFRAAAGRTPASFRRARTGFYPDSLACMQGDPLNCP